MIENAAVLWWRTKNHFHNFLYSKNRSFSYDYGTHSRTILVSAVRYRTMKPNRTNLVQNCRITVQQRSIDNVGVTDDPAQIWRRKPRLHTTTWYKGYLEDYPRTLGLTNWLTDTLRYGIISRNKHAA